ncbi:hypothetical protein MPH_11462 [Macrophomina phaseolina MS6]|uniref:Uncharacterized protein n=1 Tax=Macrophomina phaseolina (strain MS6) TaxID=1126212 RepID=K2REV4_MACPH|nr:hypothetical protein MPH_11462 [Macrophomina phaseolina MS6]
MEYGSVPNTGIEAGLSRKRPCLEISLLGKVRGQFPMPKRIQTQGWTTDVKPSVSCRQPRPSQPPRVSECQCGGYGIRQYSPVFSVGRPLAKYSIRKRSHDTNVLGAFSGILNSSSDAFIPNSLTRVLGTAYGALCSGYLQRR